MCLLKWVDGQHNDNATTWKVRKDVIKVIDALMSSYLESLREYWQEYVTLLERIFIERLKSQRWCLWIYPELYQSFTENGSREQSSLSHNRIPNLDVKCIIIHWENKDNEPFIMGNLHKQKDTSSLIIRICMFYWWILRLFKT